MAISDTILQITPRPVGGAVQLTHKKATANGNKAIVSTVTSSAFVVDGMSNGQGGKCKADDPCKDSLECASNVCNASGVCAP
jgi:hypothetical protein